MRAPVELGRREPERIGFGDIAGLEDLKRTVRLQIIEPFLKPGLFAKFRKRAATNMPWDVDPAMKRPGRFGRQVFVPPPDEAARAHIVELKLRGVPHEGIDGREVERPIRQPDLLRAAEATEATTLDWLRTARNLVKYAGADDSYRDVEAYLRQHKLV